MAIEEPRFESLEKTGAFELRAYAPMIVAQALLDGSSDEASSAGFRLIAEYIFGANITKSGATGEKIEMTAPVTLEPQSQKIEMTAPVVLAPSEQRWRVHFVMPSSYSMATLPAPKNPRVTLREVPAQKAAVISFSGFAGDEKVKQKTAELQAWMASRKLTPTSAPQLARYDPPWKLPFLRRNEVLINCL